MKKWAVRLLIAGFLLGGIFIHYILPTLYVEIRSPLTSLLRNGSSDYNEVSPTINHPNEVLITTYDNLILKGNLKYSSKADTLGTVILLHGIRSNKSQYYSIRNFLSESGYNSLALDMRAHGESQGRYCTFGVKERKDVSNTIDKLASLGIDENVGVWGLSLGGAVALQSLAVDKRLKFGIIESTFTDYPSVAQDYTRRILNVNLPKFASYLISRSGKIADFDPYDAAPVNYCPDINQPVFMAHGTEDVHIDSTNTSKNFAALPYNSDSRQKFIEGATHGNLWQIGGQTYFGNVKDFLLFSQQ